MKILNRVVSFATLVAFLPVLAVPGSAAQSASEVSPAAGNMVVTVQGKRLTPELQQGQVSVSVNGRSAPITQWTSLRDSGQLQLVFLLDESTPSSLAIQFSSLRKFIESLPPKAEVAIAYMSNGRAVMQQPLTSDHAAAAKALRLPNSIPGISGSPYFCLSELAKKWPSQAKTRRVVFMVTNGEDPYYRTRDLQDPYVRAAIADSQKAGLVVYSLYFHDVASPGFGSEQSLFGQSYLLMVSQATGGEAYTEAMTTPVSFDPFLKQFGVALNNQYWATVSSGRSGLQPVKVDVKEKGVKLRAPKRVNFGS